MGSFAGIGFTMSIFTTTLAFNEEVYRDIAKISILGSLILSMALSWIYFLTIEKKIARPSYKKFQPAYRAKLAVS